MIKIAKFLFANIFLFFDVINDEFKKDDFVDENEGKIEEAEFELNENILEKKPLFFFVLGRNPVSIVDDMVLLYQFIYLVVTTQE